VLRRCACDRGMRAPRGEALTLFAFSARTGSPRDEVMSLMSLFVESLEAEIGELHSSGVRLRFIGERAESMRGCARAWSAPSDHAINTRLNLQIALSYAGRADIVGATRRLCGAWARRNRHRADRESSFARHWRSAAARSGLFIRTGGEQRISNFLLWNLAIRALLHDCLWPDSERGELCAALQHFATRRRRFG